MDCYTRRDRYGPLYTHTGGYALPYTRLELAVATYTLLTHSIYVGAHNVGSTMKRDHAGAVQSVMICGLPSK